MYSTKIIGYIWQNYGIYWAKTIDYIMGYTWKNYELYLEEIWDIFGEDLSLYWAKTIGYFMGYIR